MMSIASRQKSTANCLSRHQQAFTLIEIMVAMAIMALVAVGAIKVLDTATVTTDNIRRDGHRLNQVQRAFLFISKDIQQITTRQVRDEFGDKIPSIKSDLQAAMPYIRFTKLGRRNPAQLTRSNLEHLSYSVEDKVLYRTSYTYADGMAENTGIKRPILNAVDDMKISFYDGESWGDFWPLTDSDEKETMVALPVALKMTLELSDYGAIERLYSLSDQKSDDEVEIADR